MMAHTGDGPFLDADGEQSTKSDRASASKPLFKVNSPNVVYTNSEINTKYIYRNTEITQGPDGDLIATPTETHCQPPWPRLGYP
jgi:myo-inositol-1-phosphate synthase